MKLTRLAVAMLCAANASLAGEIAPPAAPSPADLALKRLPSGFAKCRPEGAKEDFLCATYAVLENRAARQGRKFDLKIVLVPARAERPAPDALFLFEGGPGGAVTEWAVGVPENFGNVIAHRDVVMIDQRGTGGSNPLQCDFGVREDDPQTAYRDPFPLAAVKACRIELEKKADLTQYTTDIAMDDIDEVRAWLGYPQINLLGGSYGTRAAQVLLRRHPGSVRSAILEGVVGMNQRLPLYHARDGQRSLDLLFALCAEERCGGAFPNLRDEFLTVLKRLETTPGRAKIPHPQKPGETLELTVGRDIFAESVRSSLYGPEGAAQLPFVLHRAFLGDFTPFFRSTVGWRVGIELGLAQGMYLSVTCAEDLPFFTDAEEDFETAGTYLRDLRTRVQRLACREWPRGEIPAGFHAAVRSDVPVLMLEGNLDPVTPPVWGYAAAESLPNSRVVLVEGGHHGFDGLEPASCLPGIMDRFLETADAKGLDISCVGRLARPPFVLDEAGMAYNRRD